MGNAVIHVEVLGKDAPGLQQFFSNVFDWKLDTNNPGGYGMTDAADTGVVVGVSSPPEGAPGHVTFYVRVADIDETLEKATAGRRQRDHAEVQPGRRRDPRARRRSRGPRDRPDRVASRRAETPRPHRPGRFAMVWAVVRPAPLTPGSP